MAKLQINHHKRASIMIFVVVTMAAVGTILIASMDLGRLAYLKVKDTERRMRYQAHLDSIRAEYEEKLYREGVAAYSIRVTNNGIQSETAGSLDAGWESPRAYQVQVTSTFDQKVKLKTLKMGKRVMVNATHFSFVAGEVATTHTLTLTGDALVGPNANFSLGVQMDGDLFGTLTSSTGVVFSNGQYIGRQPKPKITLNPAAYAAVADVTTSGNQTLSDPAFGLTVLSAKVHYHTGNLTLTGDYRGRGTIFVDGTVTLGDFEPWLATDKAVIISTGGVIISGKWIGAVVITSGTVTTSTSKSIWIGGSLAANTVNATTNIEIIQDTTFALNPFSGIFYRIPGAW